MQESDENNAVVHCWVLTLTQQKTRSTVYQWVRFYSLCLQVTVPTTRREDGGITPALIPTWMACGTVEDITAAATRTGSTGPSSGGGLILWRKWLWWYDQMQTLSISTSVIQNWTDFTGQAIPPKGFHIYITKKASSIWTSDFAFFCWLLTIHNVTSNSAF